MTTPSISRTLVLARHAKAEGSASTDAARALSSRGHADAVAMGKWLAANEFSFDVVVCSTSVRTRETWQDIESAGVPGGDVSFDERVYGADQDELRNVLAGLPDAVRSVLVVGHAPTIPELTDTLADPDTSHPDALAALHSKFPTACMAVLSVAGPWASLTSDCATLTELTAPRG